VATPKKKALRRPSANPLLGSALYTIVVGPGDHEVEETDGPLKPHRASPPPSPMSLRNLAATAAPSSSPSEPPESGTSVAFGMAGGAIADETVEPSPPSPPPASPEPTTSLRDLDTTFVHVAPDSSAVRVPPRTLVNCVTEVPGVADGLAPQLS